MRASVYLVIFAACVLPRCPQPSSPTRTAELAAEPRTVSGFKMANAPNAPAVCRNLRRSLMKSSDQFFQKCLRREDVGSLLLTTNLSLYGQRICVAGRFEFWDQRRPIHH